MKIGIGISKTREVEVALAEAYRSALKTMRATSADLVFVFYSYDHGLDQVTLGSCFRKVFRQVPHIGASTWAAFSERETFEGETGLLVLALKDLDFSFDFIRVHSLREKADVCSAEVARQVGDRMRTSGKTADFVSLFVDSLNFVPGSGFSFLDRHFPQTQITGFGTSFSVPQASVICNGEVFTNALVGLVAEGLKPALGLAQNIHPELSPIAINRMSENLIIEIDEKPAFYRLCEHLMVKDDLPMMSPDEFRKHMGNLYLVEKPKASTSHERTFGEFFRSVPLLGSEMTTGMVAVGQALDFSMDHYLGQKKVEYIEADLRATAEKVKDLQPEPSLILLLTASTHFRDRDRKTSDFQMVNELFPKVPIVGVATNGEYWGGVNQFATLLIALP